MMVQQELSCCSSSFSSSLHYTCVYSLSANGLLLLVQTAAVCDPVGPIRIYRCLGSAELNVLMHCGNSAGSFVLILWIQLVSVEKTIKTTSGIHESALKHRHSCNSWNQSSFILISHTTGHSVFMPGFIREPLNHVNVPSFTNVAAVIRSFSLGRSGVT